MISSKNDSVKKSFHKTPIDKLQQRTSHMDVFARLSSVTSRRSSVACTPNVSNSGKTKPYNTLKG